MAAARGDCSPRLPHEGAPSATLAMDAAGRAFAPLAPPQPPQPEPEPEPELEEGEIRQVKVKKKRQIVQSEARAIIAKVYHFLKKELEFMVLYNNHNCDLSHLRNIQQRTADATGASLRTVSRILQEERQLPSPDAKFPSPMKNRRRRANKVDIDKERADIVRATIKEFEAIHGKMPTLKKLRLILQEKIGFTGCLATLQKLLIKLGYQWNKVGNGRRVLVEGVVPTPVEKKPPRKRKATGPKAKKGASWVDSSGRPVPTGAPAPAVQPHPAHAFNTPQVPVEVIYGGKNDPRFRYMI